MPNFSAAAPAGWSTRQNGSAFLALKSIPEANAEANDSRE